VAITADPADLAAFNLALDTLELDSQADRWATDPAAWVTERLKAHPWSKQVEIMASVRDNYRTAVPACHGPGKSQMAAWLIAWWVVTKPLGDSVVVTTAPTAQQVRAILWRYLRRIHRAGALAGFITQGQVPEWKIDGELVAFGRKPADYDQDAFQGMHDDQLLVVFDEACGIPEQLWNAAESLMTNDQSCRFLAIGNPTSTSSHFYEVCTTSPGWVVIPISAYDTPNLTGEPVPPDVARRLVQRTWVEDKVLRWGAGSPIFKAKVLGEFADDEDALIPMSWVVAAQHRWLEWKDSGVQPPGAVTYGVDVGHMGEDNTVIATRKRDVIIKLESWAKTDTVTTTNLVEARLDASIQSVAVVDGIGIGAGVVDLLRHHGKNVRPFVASAKSARRDATSMLRFPNCRSAAWWNLRELLDPALGSTLCLPPDDDLAADLCAPGWAERSGGIIQVEAKDDVKKRLGRSTDKGDAVVQAFWHSPNPPVRPGARTLEQRPRPRQYRDNGGDWTV
jgi:hypothetical protein